MKFTIIDPQGLHHGIEFIEGRPHGYENIAHGWEPEARGAVIEAVLVALMKNTGFRKVPLPFGFNYAA